MKQRHTVTCNTASCLYFFPAPTNTSAVGFEGNPVVSHNIGELVPGPPQISKSMDTQVPYVKWHSICI